MGAYEIVKILHILGAAVLFGTGLGIAFFMLVADRRGDIAGIVATTRIVVLADFLFTATAAVLQPITGAALVELTGGSFGDSWVAASLLLYVVIGACWLPVVSLQMRIRDLAVAAQRTNQPLPDAYHRLMHIWFLLGWPAFIAILAIFVLMVAKPVLW